MQDAPPSVRSPACVDILTGQQSGCEGGLVWRVGATCEDKQTARQTKLLCRNPLAAGIDEYLCCKTSLAAHVASVDCAINHSSGQSLISLFQQKAVSSL